MNPKIIPTVLILLVLSTAVAYALAGDFRRVILLVAVTVLMVIVIY